uniref:Gamma tubulin complex component C-terminal domain-containing protein n=1 Tax=Neospora caninum (strain Liverpool) TaxID=572307 RepID=A0A0F7UAG5_NEOCL|nr:TPA: hypothetical protein BN1204_014600 [Neospora caninum Liverpool]
MRRDCAHPQRRPESAEAQLSSSASFSLRSSAAWGPATLLSLLAERCEQKDGGSARFEPRRESRRRLLKNAAWECLLLPALRHRLPSADPRDTVPIRSTTTAASSPCPPSSSPFSSSSFSSCARSWALEISQQLILRGREEDGQALLLLSEVLLSRSSSAFPSLPPSSSAVTFLKSGGFCERRLRDPGAVVYLLLLLSAPLAAPRDSREDATNPSGNANREKLPDGCRASDFSRQVLGVAGVRTPQLDARLLRLAFTGKLAPGAAREIPSVSPPASILSEGVSAELKEEIRAAARRLGFRGRCAVLPASTTQTQMGKAGTDGEGIACNEDDRKRRGDTGEERDNVGERDKDREREDSNFGQELPSERRVEKMCSGVLLPRERPGPVSTQLSVANRSHSSEEDLSAAFSSLSLGSGIAELELDQESGQCRAGDNLSPAGNLCPDRSRGEARESGPSSLRSLFAPVSPPEFSFRPFGALPFPALMEKGAAACTFSEATPLSLCDAQGDRLDVYSQPHGRDRKVEEREARERAFAWRHGGAWRGCFHREGLAPSLLAPVKEDECPFRLGSLHAEEPFAVQSENPFATPSSVSASSSSASSFSGVPDAPFPSALSSDFSASPGVAFRSSSGPGHRPSGGGDESTPPPFPERSLSFFSLPQSRLLGADEGRFAFFSASFEGRQTSEETEGRDAGTRKANNFFGKLDTLGRDKAARVDTPVVRPLQFPWTSETEEAAALEGERRKTLPGRYRAEAPRDETAPTAAVATPDAWEREMTAWLYSQEAASQSSGARKDEVLRVPTRFASWDMRMLQPRIQRVAELLDRRKIEPSDAGWTTESWTSQMLSCIDSRTAECMGTFLATAYGTMTVGGLDSRFALLSADSRSNRERCPYVRPVPALVSAASSAIVPRRLTLAAVLSTSPPPPPPFGFRACPRVRTPRAVFSTAPLWLQCCVSALQGCDSLLFRTAHSRACRRASFEDFSGLSAQRGDQPSPWFPSFCASRSARRCQGDASFFLPRSGQRSVCVHESPLVHQEGRRLAEIRFSSIRLPPLSLLLSAGPPRDANGMEDTENRKRGPPFRFGTCEQPQAPFFASCCDLRYAPAGWREDENSGVETEAEDRETLRCLGEAFPSKPQSGCPPWQQETREQRTGGVNRESEIADPAWTPVFEEIAKLASLLRRLRAFVAFFSSALSLPHGERHCPGLTACPSQPRVSKHGDGNGSTASCSLDSPSSETPRGFGLTVGAFVAAVESVLSDFDAFLLSDEVYVHLRPGDNPSSAFPSSPFPTHNSSATLSSFPSSPLALLPCLREWKTRIVFLARICCLDFPEEASSRIDPAPREPPEAVFRSAGKRTGTALFLVEKKNQQRREEANGSCMLLRCTDTWWAFPRGSSLLERIFSFASSVQSEAVYTPHPRGFLSLENLLFSTGRQRRHAEGTFCGGINRNSAASPLCWSLALHLLLQSMSPLLEFLENWVFRANVYDPGDEFLRPLPGGSPSRFPSLTLGCTYRRRLTDSGHADSRVGCLWPLEDEANGACVSSFFSDEDAQQRWSDRAAGAVGAASQVNFVLPSFLLSIQQEIHKTGLLLLILLHASPEAFQAASLATSFSRSSSPSFSSFPSAASTSMAASTSLAPSLAGESVKCESVPPKPEAEPATAPDPAAASVLAFAVPSLTLEGFSRTLDMRNGMTSRSFFSSHVQPFASLLASAPAASPSLPGSEAALACASSVSFPFAEAKQARTGGRRGPGVLEFSVFLRELLRVEQKYRGLRALGLTRVWCLVEAQQVCVQLREAAREEQFRRARAFLHQRIRLSHQTQLLQLQRARLSREMIRAAAALASQKTTSCPSLTDVWREVAKRQKEEQKSVLDRQRQEQEAARRRREAADASGLALEAAENRRSLKERQERLHADLERQLREQRLEFEQLEQQLKQLQQLQRDMGKSFSSLSPVSHPNVCLHGDPQLLVGRSSAKTRFESRKLTAGLMHAEHAVQTAAAALASVERALERRRAREREREKGREDADDSRGGKGVHVSQPPGGNSVIGDLLKDPEKEKKEDGDPFRASSLASPALPPPSSASICLSYDLSSRGEESNASPGKDQLSRAVPASPGERKREDANEASSSATDTATSETKKAEKETRVCSPALSEAIQIEAGAWTTTAASSPRTGDSVDSLEETPFTENGDEDRYEEEASEHREEGGRWRKELERRGDQGNLNRSIWICVGQAVATQHAVANRAFLALMGPQHCDLLGCLDTVKKFILFGASDVMGQFAVDLIAELQKKEAEEKKLRRAFLSRATSKEGCSADPSSRLTGCTYAQDFESSRKLHVARYTELINTLFASALAPISFAPPQPCASEGARDAGGAKPSRRFPGAHGHCGAGVEARHAVLGVSSTTASNVAVSFQLSGGNVRAGGDESASPDSPRNQESRGRNVEELLMDVEVSMHAPFPLTLFFDAETKRMYTRIFQFLALLTLSLHCIHHVWHHLSRLHQVADARLRRGRWQLRSAASLPTRDGEGGRAGASVSPRGVASGVSSRERQQSRECPEREARAAVRGIFSDPHSPAATGRSWRRRSRNGDEDACAGDWAEDGFLLPPGLYAHMWQLCVKMKFVTDAFHGYVITDALQTEWTALTVYIHRTVEAALAPPRCRRSAKDRHSRDTSPHPIPLACAARESAQTPSNRFSSSPQGGTGNLARSGGTPQCRPSGAAEEGSETLKRPEVRNFETRRLTAADSGEEASAFGLFAAHRKTITSIHTRCLLSPRLAPLHQHVMDVLRASWALRALQQQLEGDERHLRDLLVQQTKKWRELSRQRGQVDKEALDLPAEKARVVRASFANFLQAPDAVQPNSSSPRNAPPQQNCGIGELIQREEEAILAAKRGIERAGVAAGLVAAQQLLKIEKTFNAACDGLMRALQKLEPLQLLDALALRLDFNRFYSREAAMKAARASVERKVRGL